MRSKTTRNRRLVALGAALLAGAAISGGVAVSQVERDESPPMGAVAAPAGGLEIADPGGPVDTDRLQIVAEADNQLVLRGPSTEPDHECLVVAPADAPTTMAMTGCDPNGVFSTKGAFLAEVDRDGSVSGAVLLPDGASEVLLNGTPAHVTNGVVTFRDVPESVTVTARTPSGRFEQQMVGRGDYDSTPGVMPPEHVPVLRK